MQAHGRSKIRTSATSCSIHAQSLHAARETLALQCVIAGLDIIETLFGRGLTNAESFPMNKETLKEVLRQFAERALPLPMLRRFPQRCSID